MIRQLLSVCISVLLMACTSSTVSPNPSKAVRIMPLGDSLTEGQYPDGYHSYRGYLRKMLLDKGYNAEFVGDQNGQAHGDANPPALEHSGHGGYTIGPDTRTFYSGGETVGLFEHIEAWLGKANPDVILLLIGINDMFSPETHPKDYAKTAPERLEALVKRVQSLRPNAKILLASLLRVTWTDGSNWPEYSALNTKIRSLVTLSATDAIELVDLNSIKFAKEDYFDALHLNGLGAQKVASAWLERLEPLLNKP
jgi:lysophospholipase L1-like esterase